MRLEEGSSMACLWRGVPQHPKGRLEAGALHLLGGLRAPVPLPGAQSGRPAEPRGGRGPEEQPGRVRPHRGEELLLK